MSNYKKLPPIPCPVCKETNTMDAGMRTKQKLSMWMTHVKARARVEAFNKLFFEDDREVPHFDWIKENTVIVEHHKFITKV